MLGSVSYTGILTFIESSRSVLSATCLGVRRRSFMSVSYKKLWIHLIEKNMKRTDLIKLTGITSNTLANMGKDEYIYEKLRKNM